MTTHVLYLFGSAAPPVFDVAKVIEDAQARGFDVCLGLTPTAARWLAPKLPELERLTGHPVRSEYKMPGEPDVWPKADVIAVAPATFNTVNAWALGLTRDFVVGVVAEGIGKRIPTVAMPCVNAAYVQHRQFERRRRAARHGRACPVRRRRLRAEPARPGQAEGIPLGARPRCSRNQLSPDNSWPGRPR